MEYDWSWKTERSKSQIDTESHWQVNCRYQLSLKKLGANGVNTKAVTSEISGRFERGNSSMDLTFAAYLYTHTHTNTHTRARVYVHRYIYT